VIGAAATLCTREGEGAVMEAFVAEGSDRFAKKRREASSPFTCVSVTLSSAEFVSEAIFRTRLVL
jgi:hypothetical protein